MVQGARYAQPDRVLGVVQIQARGAWRDRVQGVVPTARPWCQVILCRGGAVMRVTDGNERPAAEHAHATDRFAREIVGFLTRLLWRACGG